MMRFREFWPHYLRAHRNRANRLAHYGATTLSFTAIAVSIASGEVWIAPVCILVSYAIALTAHRVFERNHSLVFVNPVWGAVADLKMCWLALTDGLDRELALHAGEAAGQREINIRAPQNSAGKFSHRLRSRKAAKPGLG
jgi:hypothetical protein